MSAQLYTNQIGLNCRKMLRNSRKYQTEKEGNRSCDIGDRKNLKNWIQINKKQFLIKRPRQHHRSYSLQERASSQVKKIQIRFPSCSLSKTTRPTRSNSTESSASADSSPSKASQALAHPRQHKTNTSLLFFIMNQENDQKNTVKVRGLKENNKIAEIFRKANFDANGMVVRGKGIL